MNTSLFWSELLRTRRSSKNWYFENATLIAKMDLRRIDKIELDDLKRQIMKKRLILAFPKHSSLISLLTDDYEEMNKEKYDVKLILCRYEGINWKCFVDLNLAEFYCSASDEWCGALFHADMLRLDLHVPCREDFTPIEDVFSTYKPKEMNVAKE